MSRNYISEKAGIASLVLAAGVLVGVAAMAMIPSFTVAGLEFERTNLFGSTTFAPASAPAEFKADINNLDKELEQFEQLKTVVADTSENEVRVVDTWCRQAPDTTVRKKIKADSSWCFEGRPGFVPIEDYDTSAVSALDRLGSKLLGGRPVRIAFMGDSFIEGDIITSDLRKMMQATFGGSGVGFIPADIPFKIYNKSVTRLSSGWQSYSIMKQKSVPERIRDKFLISGYMACGGPGAGTVWEDKTENPGADQAVIYLYSLTDSKVSVTVNGTDTCSFRIPADGLLHSVELQAAADKVSIEVLSGETICYGVRIATCTGVCIDNFSVRSNNGQAIFGASAMLNRQLDELVDYDMVILQYGLNILQDGKTSYIKYAQQLGDIVTYIRKCFPDAAVLVMGVSDRWIKDQGAEEFRPLESASILTEAQRKVAEKTGVCFWNTYKAMESLGGMSGFVENGWVSADHTHINYRGGRAFASKMYDAMLQCVFEAWDRKRAEELAPVHSEGLDSLMRREMLLQTGLAPASGL